MILVVVYVGAVAVLFLFVVMMLDVDFTELRRGIAELSADRRRSSAWCWWSSWCVVGRRLWAPRPARSRPGRSPTPADVTNTEALGRILYTNYIYYFQIAGLVLLVAMIGAIVLTLRHKPGVKRQVIADQVAAQAGDRHRSPAKVKPGKGA